MVFVKGMVDLTNLVELLFGVLGVEFVQHGDARWVAQSFGGTRYALNREEGGVRITWTIDEAHPRYRDEVKAFGNHTDLADFLILALRREGLDAEAASE